MKFKNYVPTSSETFQGNGGAALGLSDTSAWDNPSYIWWWCHFPFAPFPSFHGSYLLQPLKTQQQLWSGRLKPNDLIDPCSFDNPCNTEENYSSLSLALNVIPKTRTIFSRPSCFLVLCWHIFIFQNDNIPAVFSAYKTIKNTKHLVPADKA